MSKIMLVVLPLMFVLAFTMGGTRTVPQTASPAKHSVTAPKPEFGSCRWYCGSKSYSTAAQCAAKCSTVCEDIC